VGWNTHAIMTTDTVHPVAVPDLKVYQMLKNQHIGARLSAPRSTMGDCACDGGRLCIL